MGPTQVKVIAHCRKLSNGGEVREEEDETHNEAEAGLRALVLIVEVLEEL